MPKKGSKKFASRPVFSKRHRRFSFFLQIHFRREDFNDRLRAVREKKLALQKEVQVLTRKLRSIHSELPDEFVKPLPDPIVFDEEVEFPENNLKVK